LNTALMYLDTEKCAQYITDFSICFCILCQSLDASWNTIPTENELDNMYTKKLIAILIIQGIY